MTGFCEIDPFGESADMLLSQSFTLAAMKRRRMRARSFRGKMRAAESRRLPQGKAPYGRSYNRDSGTWSINEAEATTYRRIFAMALEGRSTNEIRPASTGRESRLLPARAGRSPT
jgi:DNA invertase Pin-like site-specific DNA recombinase